MDPAFQSRIDLTIHYPDLSESSRASVWRNFLQAGEGTSTEIDFDELASHVMNGRQIKNTVKLAKMLAIRRSQALHMDHFRQILQLSASQPTQGMTSLD
jgi:ATP-dependent 26S proteasome regulatory subunit